MLEGSERALLGFWSKQSNQVWLQRWSAPFAECASASTWPLLPTLSLYTCAGKFLTCCPPCHLLNIDHKRSPQPLLSTPQILLLIIHQVEEFHLHCTKCQAVAYHWTPPIRPLKTDLLLTPHSITPISKQFQMSSYENSVLPTSQSLVLRTLPAGITDLGKQVEWMQGCSRPVMSTALLFLSNIHTNIFPICAQITNSLPVNLKINKVYSVVLICIYAAATPSTPIFKIT